MDSNTKNTEDGAGHVAFVVGGESFSTICKINEAIGYLIRVEVSWGNFLPEVIYYSAIESIGINYGTVREDVQVADEVLDTLERRCRWVRIVTIDTVHSAPDIRAGVLHNTKKFSNMRAEFY